MALATISELQANLADRLQDPAGTFWLQTYEQFSAIAEGINDLLLLIGRPTQLINIPVTLTPNICWQTLPANMLAITTIRSSTSMLWKTSLYAMDYLQSSWGCYDENTEILTSNGWMRFSDLTYRTPVATLNKKGELEYQEPTAYHAYPYSGDLFSYESQSVDLRVTPNHKIYISPMDSDKWGLVKAEDLKIKHFNMKKDAIWHGVECESITIAGKEIAMDLWLEFMGYWLSEGYASSSSYDRPARIQRFKNEKTGEYYSAKTSARTQTSYIVGVCQSQKSDAYHKIESCLKKMPFKFSRGSGSQQWSTNSKALWGELKIYGKANEKAIPSRFKDLCPRQLRILYDAMMAGDGTETDKVATYYTSSRLMADDFQEIVLKLGMASDVHVIDRVGQRCANGTRRQLEYQVGIRRKNFMPRKAAGWVPKKIRYEGLVHCVTVPNHVVYVRRNGKAVWCGNSDWEGDVAMVPQRWAPLGLTYFLVHPAPSTPITVQMTGIANPILTPWPPTGSEISPFHNEFNVALQMYAAAYCKLKTLGDDALEGDVLFQEYLDIAQRLSQISDRRDPLIFSRAFGTPSAPSVTTLR